MHNPVGTTTVVEIDPHLMLYLNRACDLGALSSTLKSVCLLCKLCCHGRLPVQMVIRLVFGTHATNTHSTKAAKTLIRFV